ncbi:hypothetical protein MSG28_000615 [Choristoneura fumiferana]|uniref:Uncharacterized protein n=1 Tax=Choristoneura fumiferana TaxID=7141 RepID=A0ACC0K1Q9_CHOFU|nr:hypothetical protein MSG28_000615 [Choristoneura fumiferana]
MRFLDLPRDFCQIPEFPINSYTASHLPAAEPILPGHTLLRPALGMLKSAIKFPHRENENGEGVYGHIDNLGISVFDLPSSTAQQEWNSLPATVFLEHYNFAAYKFRVNEHYWASVLHRRPHPRFPSGEIVAKRKPILAGNAPVKPLVLAGVQCPWAAVIASHQGPATCPRYGVVNVQRRGAHCVTVPRGARYTASSTCNGATHVASRCRAVHFIRRRERTTSRWPMRHGAAPCTLYDVVNVKRCGPRRGTVPRRGDIRRRERTTAR